MWPSPADLQQRAWGMRASRSSDRGRPAAHALTNGVLWWQVNSVRVKIFQERSVHKVRELMDLDGVLVHFVQQRAEMFTPKRTHVRYDRGREKKTTNKPTSYIKKQMYLLSIFD